jgi:hypothetical protein
MTSIPPNPLSAPLPAPLPKPGPSPGWAADATRIDQVVYAWARRTRTSGEGYLPIASSLSSAATRSWNDLLAGQVERGDAYSDQTPSSLSYLVTRPDPRGSASAEAVPQAALVHRIRIPSRSGPGRGRMRAHVLIGRADYLTERVALALHAAGDSPTARTTPRLTPLHLPDLTAQRRTGERSLRQAARAATRRHRLANLVATVLAWSWTQRPFAVSHTGSDEAVLLMWALVEMLEGVLPYRLTFSSHITASHVPPAIASSPAAMPGPAVAASPAAGASSAEVSPDTGQSVAFGAGPGTRGRCQPRFLFIPVPPELAPGIDPAAIHVDPRVRPYVPPVIYEAARLLVDVYGQGGLRGVSSLLARAGDEVLPAGDSEQWCRRLVGRRGPGGILVPSEAGDAGRPRTAADLGALPREVTNLRHPPRTVADLGTPPTPGDGSGPARRRPADGSGTRAREGAAAAVAERAVNDHLRAAYESLLTPSGEAGTDPVRTLITILTAPIGLSAELPSVGRLGGQVRRVAGLLTVPRGRPGPAVPVSAAQLTRAEITAHVLGRLERTDPSAREHGLAQVEAAVAARARRIEGAITTLADDLAAVRGPSHSRGVEESMSAAVTPLAAGLASLFSACGLPDADNRALRLATATLNGLRAALPTPPPAGQPHPAGGGHASVTRPSGPSRGWTPGLAAARPRPQHPPAWALAVVTQHVAEAYRREWEYWDGRLHPVDRLLAALGVPLGVSLAGPARDPLAAPLSSPAELRELAALRDLLVPRSPAHDPIGPGPTLPPSSHGDLLARAASGVTQAITRRASGAHLGGLDQGRYVGAVHDAVTTTQCEVVEMVATLVADLGSLAATPPGTHRPDLAATLLRTALRSLFDRFGLPEGYGFADTLAAELAAAPAAPSRHHSTPGEPTAAGEPTAPRLVAFGSVTRGFARPTPNSAAGTVARLLRETDAWGADAFRLLVLYAPHWHGADDIRRAIVDATPPRPGPGESAAHAGSGGPAALAAGARPFFARLAMADPIGRGPARTLEVARRVLALYRPAEVPTRASPAAVSSPTDLRLLDTELATRLPGAGDLTESDPAIAFLADCESGPPDPARIFGLLARHVPSWDGEQDLHEALWRWGRVGRDDARGAAGEDIGPPPTGPALAAAAERYFRRAARAADADAGGPHPADLERVTRRLAALYLPEDPRLQAAGELPRVVESRIVAEIAAAGPKRRRHRSFGLPVFPLILTISAVALAARIR